jgi:hypothetical protein
MSSEPTFPKDAAVGDPPKLNETLTAAVTAKEAEEAATGKAKGSTSTRSFVRGAAIGVGSAALVAALLYANTRTRKGDRSDTTTKPIGVRDDD